MKDLDYQQHHRIKQYAKGYMYKSVRKCFG